MYVIPGVEGIVTAVEEWVNVKDHDFFSSRLMKIKPRWSKCVTLVRNYIQTEEVDHNRNKIDWLIIDSLSYVHCFNLYSYLF